MIKFAGGLGSRVLDRYGIHHNSKFFFEILKLLKSLDICNGTITDPRQTNIGSDKPLTSKTQTQDRTDPRDNQHEPLQTLDITNASYVMYSVCLSRVCYI